jgi:undecaprenyl diphosphate synthase
MTNSNIQHLGFIMDGNRRWAKEHGLPVFFGHKKGYETAFKVVEWCMNKGIKVITLYTFSTENWNRTKKEVEYLMNLSERAIKEKIKTLHKNGIKVQFIGRLQQLSEKLQKTFQTAMELTKDNNLATLNIAFNYGGHAEIIDAVNRLLKKRDWGKKIDEKTFQKYLYDSQMPPVDLVIRTSGEMRISGFMLWEAAYSELYFTKTYWPAFSEKNLDEALAEYDRRQRRFGK